METSKTRHTAGGQVSDVWQAMIDQGYDLEDLETWTKNVQMFHMAKVGGIAFVTDSIDPKVWWLHAYCPNDRPSDNTVRFLIELAFRSGCDLILSAIKRRGAGRFLERIGFGKLSKQLYAIRAN